MSKKRLMAFMLSAALAGSLCMDMTAFAKEAVKGTEASVEAKSTAVTARAVGSDDDEYYDETYKWKLENGVLTISGTGYVDGGYWGTYKDQIQKVVIEEGIKWIDADCFSGDMITEISIPASVTDISFESSGSEDDYTKMFTNKSLKRINVSEGNSVYASVDGVLYNKAKTVLMCFPNGREGTYTVPSGVNALGRNLDYSAFEGSRLTGITIPDSVTQIGGFRNCVNLKSIVIPSRVDYMPIFCFSGCRSLESVTILNKKMRMESEFGNAEIREEAVIYGYTGSTAEAYAKKYGNKFVALDAAAAKPVVKVSAIKLSGVSNKIAAGKRIKLTAKIAPSNAANKKLTWKSSNKKVATVNGAGVVTMKKGSGGKSVTITAIAKDGSGKKAVYKIKSMKGAVRSVRLSGKKTVKVGKSVKLKAVVKAQKNANKAVKWTSSNTKYAKVSKSGKVTAYKAGKGKTVTVTAQAVDGTGKKAKLKIKIK